MKPILPYTREELNALLPKMEVELQATQDEFDCKPVGPLTLAEAKEYLLRLGSAAQTRQWTRGEAFLHGQLLAQYEMAVRADTLGYKGRYIVMSEDRLRAEMARHA